MTDLLANIIPTRASTTGVVATAPIVQLRDTHGNHGIIGTHHFFTPDKKFVPVVYISGNSIRGQLRRLAGEITGTALGVEEWENGKISRLVYAGGSLEKESSKLDTAAIRGVLDLVPLIGLFGASGAGTIMPGRLTVGHMQPVCWETSTVTGVESDVRAVQLIDEVQQTRRDPEQDRHSGNKTLTKEEALAILNGTTETKTSKTESVQMIYTFEDIAPGTNFTWSIAIDAPATQLERALLHLILTGWRAQGCPVGGKQATGFGTVRVPDEVFDTFAIPDAEAMLLEHHQEHREPILQALELLAS